jgi:hypothetical protein
VLNSNDGDEYHARLKFRVLKYVAYTLHQFEHLLSWLVHQFNVLLEHTAQHTHIYIVSHYIYIVAPLIHIISNIFLKRSLKYIP